MARKPTTPPAPARSLFPVLSFGMHGDAVKAWQNFLRREVAGSTALDENLSFDAMTDALTRSFQNKAGLPIDGVVGVKTWDAAARLDKDLETLKSERQEPDAYPKRSATLRPMSDDEANQKFGDPSANMASVDGATAEQKWISNEYRHDHIVPVRIPQLGPVPGAPDSGIVEFHKDASEKLIALFRAWERAGLMAKVLSFGSAFAARGQRPDPTRAQPPETMRLSMHARGLAFDINEDWNLLGQEPAMPSQPGCVYDLVPLAYENGFVWGGHFRDRLEGGHFEIGFAVPAASPPDKLEPPKRAAAKSGSAKPSTQKKAAAPPRKKAPRRSR